MQLYANVVHSFNIPGIPARHEGVDIVIIRENTEGEYSGMEHEVAPGVTESLKVRVAWAAENRINWSALRRVLRLRARLAQRSARLAPASPTARRGIL